MMRPATVLLAFVLATTVALSQQPAQPTSPDREGARRISGNGAKTHGAKTQGAKTEGNRKQGVGSRALTSPEYQEKAADQPQMATGVDLKGPPMRFAPVDTPE
jgi:hypothetical protein